MSEAVTENKTLLKQAQENLKKAKEARRNEKVLAEFGKRSKELLEAAKIGENSIQFNVPLTQSEALELRNLFLEEGVAVRVYYYGLNTWFIEDCLSYFTNRSNTPIGYTFLLTIPSA